MPAISIHDLLWEPSKHPAKAVCVVYGDDSFLKFHAVRLLRDQVLDGEDAEFSLTRLEGAVTRIDDVLKEVSTRAMFGSDRRFVLVEDADSFVSKYRDALEQYVVTPSNRAVLLLQLQSFPSNTRLYKQLAETGLVVEAKALPEKGFAKWIAQWSKRQYKTPCDADAAAMLLERVGPEHGLLDQELSKLSLMVPSKGSITVELVEKAVGSWRTQSVFAMLDLALTGQTTDAIRQLDHLFLAGEDAFEILPRIAPTLRKFAAATELILEAEKNGKRLSVVAALEQAGIKHFVLEQAAKQLKHLGRHRGAKLLDWLLQADLDLKGASRSDPRFILETLIVKISEPKLRVP